MSAPLTPIGDDINLLVDAVNAVTKVGFASPSHVQRKIRVGFAKALRLLILMEERGIVGPAVGTHARDVLTSTDQIDAVIAALRAEVAS